MKRNKFVLLEQKGGEGAVSVQEPEMKGRSEAHEPSQDIGGRAAVLVDPDLPIGQHRLLFYIPAISLDELEDLVYNPRLKEKSFRVLKIK